MSSGTTSNSTMSTKLAVIANLNIHFRVTSRFASLQIQPNGYGFGCGMVSSLSFLMKSSEIKFACDPLSNNVSILICLDMTATHKLKSEGKVSSEGLKQSDELQLLTH